MPPLETDTLYYRWDHPNGFMFSAGNDEPDPAEGWVAAPQDVQPGPAVTYECTTLAAFQALLDSERKGSTAQIASLQSNLAQARTAFALLSAQAQSLESELAVLRGSQGG